MPAAGPTIVFCRTRRGADRLSKQLANNGVRTEAIHGGRSQNQRDRALAAFTDGRVDALVATDVAARGIHVDGVACVVHFDTPEDEKAYLHRSGRTARAGATGLVVSFVSNADRRTVARMQRILDIPGALTAPDVRGLADVVTAPHRGPYAHQEHSGRRAPSPPPVPGNGTDPVVTRTHRAVAVRRVATTTPTRGAAPANARARRRFEFGSNRATESATDALPLTE